MLTTSRVTQENISLLDNLAEDVFDVTIDPRRLAIYLGSDGHLLIVAHSGEQVVGQVAAYVHHHVDHASDLYIDNIGVCPEFQRQGIARRLVDDMMAWGEELGCEQAWIVTDTANIAARNLYASLGAEAETIVMYSCMI
jgi:ribosomal protein S18 acetylase RimI-like enzyme